MFGPLFWSKTTSALTCWGASSSDLVSPFEASGNCGVSASFATSAAGFSSDESCGGGGGIFCD